MGKNQWFLCAGFASQIGRRLVFVAGEHENAWGSPEAVKVAGGKSMNDAGRSAEERSWCKLERAVAGCNGGNTVRKRGWVGEIDSTSMTCHHIKYE